MALALPRAALARIGGGESYSTGSGSDAGDGDGLFGVLLEVLLWLVFNHPAIGIPLALVVLVVAIQLYGKSGDASTRKALALRDAEAAVRLSGASADRWVSALRAKDPAFELLPFLDRVKGQWLALQEAWFRRDLGPVRRYVSDATWQRLLTQLELQRLDGVRDAVAQLEAFDLSLVGLEQSRGFDTLRVAIKARGRDTEVSAEASDDLAREVALQAPQETFLEVWSFVRRPEARTRTDSAACPSCGAPWEGGATNVCGHCKAVVNSGAFDWTLAEITQGVEHAPAAAPAGVDALRAEDPAFHVEGLEDRASLCFWRWIYAQVTGQPDSLRRLATPAFLEAMREELGALAARQERRSASECAVGAASLRSVEREGGRFLAHVEVRFSARWGRKAAGAGPLPLSPLRWIFTLERSAAARTDASRGISSAVCPSCGAPAGESTAPACEFCGAALGASEREWILCAAAPWERWMARAAVAPSAPPKVDEVIADRSERQRLLYTMGQLAAADGAVADKERRQLESCAQRWGLPPEDVEQALSPTARGAGLTDALRPGSREAEVFLQSLISLARVDGRVDHNERRLLEQVAGRLGVGPRLEALLRARGS